MRVKRQSMVAAVLLVTLAFLGVVYSASGVTAQIPFKFNAGGKSLPAGTYQCDYMQGGRAIKLTNAETQESAVLTIVTTIAAQPGGKSIFVFDKEGEERYLSELHLEGQDGLIFQGAPGAHTHTSVPAGR